MLVPNSKLLFWTAAVLVPFAFLATVVPAAAGVSLFFIVALCIVALVDAVLARQQLASLGLQLAGLTRMSKARPAKLDLRLHNPGLQQRHVRLGLPWPYEFTSATETLAAVLPPAAEWSQLPWPCTPLKRGNYKLAVAYLENTSPLGLWAARKSVPIASEIRVYPNILLERKSLSALFLNRGQLGLHAQRQVGKGRDFEKLREYVPGDGYDEIHWKATARRGKPITKVFQIEKTQEVYVIIDASRLSARPAKENGLGDSTLERFVTAALILGLAAEKQHDLFGLLTFTNRVEKFVRAKNGQAHYNACRNALYELQPQVVTPDFDEVCTFIRLRLRRRALLVFLTALDDPTIAESFVRNIELLRRQHLVLVNMLPPQGVKPLFTNPRVTEIDELYQELGGHLRWEKLRELQKVLQRHGVQFSLLAEERLCADLVAQYLNIKQRQLL